jgi:hypothetical protein
MPLSIGRSWWWPTRDPVPAEEIVKPLDEQADAKIKEFLVY